MARKFLFWTKTEKGRLIRNIRSEQTSINAENLQEQGSKVFKFDQRKLEQSPSATSEKSIKKLELSHLKREQKAGKKKSRTLIEKAPKRKKMQIKALEPISRNRGRRRSFGKNNWRPEHDIYQRLYQNRKREQKDHQKELAKKRRDVEVEGRVTQAWSYPKATGVSRESPTRSIQS